MLIASLNKTFPSFLFPHLNPGSESGLLLTLNVEQYEYMPGPQDAAGVRVLIHDGKEFPKVHELGIAFPTGSHSFVGVKLISVNSTSRQHSFIHYFLLFFINLLTYYFPRVFFLFFFLCVCVCLF